MDENQELIHAVEINDLNTVKRLLNFTNVNTRNNENSTILMIAAYEGNYEIVKLLIEKGADVNLHDEDFNTPLVFSTIRKHHEISKILLKAGANPNIHNECVSPLLNSYDNEELIYLLVKKNAHVNFVNDEGESVIGKVFPNLRMLTFLVERGADINGRGSFQRTPLMNAAFFNCISCVNFLLQLGADVNLQDKNYNTALIYAAFRDFPIITELLLEKGAILSIKGINDKTALELAGSESEHVIENYILQIINILSAFNISSDLAFAISEYLS